MALNHLETSAISSVSAESKKLLDSFGALTQINVLFNGAPNLASSITQQDIGEHPMWGVENINLSEQTLDDAVFALATIRDTISNALPALSVLARIG